jgi:hypothetical protein
VKPNAPAEAYATERAGVRETREPR